MRKKSSRLSPLFARLTASCLPLIDWTKRLISLFCYIIKDDFAFVNNIMQIRLKIIFRGIFMRLKELREERNFTQKQIGDAIMSDQSNVARWEKGINQPSAEFIIRLADFFGVSTDYLLGRSDD